MLPCITANETKEKSRGRPGNEATITAKLDMGLDGLQAVMHTNTAGMLAKGSVDKWMFQPALKVKGQLCLHCVIRLNFKVELDA